MKRVLLCVNLQKEKSLKALNPVLKKLDSLGLTVSYEISEISLCDLVITIGGDGTILKHGKTAAKAKKPLLGINTGTLGFMATLETNELDKLKLLLNNDYRISRRIMLDVKTSGETHLALNDVVLKRDAGARLPEFSVSVGESEVTRIRADGLIFSTPTGSTAYALSAGGPILKPELSCIEFTPLCAHTLFGRPMIFSGDDTLNINFTKHSKEDLYLTADGEEGVPINQGQSIEIKKSEHYLDIIDINKNSFYNSVHNKLMKPIK